MLLGLALVPLLAFAQPESPDVPPAWRKTVQVEGCVLDRNRAHLPDRSAVAFVAACRSNVLSQWTSAVVLVTPDAAAEKIAMPYRPGNLHLNAKGALAWTSASGDTVLFHEMDLTSRAIRQTGELPLKPKSRVIGVATGRLCDLYMVVSNADPSRNAYTVYSAPSAKTPTDAGKIADNTFLFPSHQIPVEASFLVRDERNPPGPMETRPGFEMMNCEGRRTPVDPRFASKIASLRLRNGPSPTATPSPTGDLLVRLGSLDGEVVVFRGDDVTRIANPPPFSHGEDIGFSNAIFETHWSPNGAAFMVAIGYEVRIYRTADLKIMARLPVDQPLNTNVGFLGNESAYMVSDNGRGALELYGWKPPR